MRTWDADTYGFETLAIHAGQDPDPTTGAVVVPIYQTSTYVQSEVGVHQGYEYSRSGNPTRTALETCLAALEQGTTGLAFASGLAAEDCLLRTVCVPGSHVVIPDDAYGGTYRLFAQVLQRWGVEHTAVPLGDPARVREALRPETVLVWCETPTNPLLGVADIAALAEVAHDAGALLVVDNTFASPYLQQPLTLGADVVVHSTTKYLGGALGRRGGRTRGPGRRAGRAAGLPPERPRRGARRVSTPGWSCAGRRPWAYGWTGTAPTPPPSSTCWSATRRWRACSTRGCLSTRVSRWPRSR